MKISKLMLSFGTLALAVASAASNYQFSLFSSSFLAGKELKAGDYRIQVTGDKATIKAGQQVVSETPVKVENGTQKFDETSVNVSTVNGKSLVTSIRLGGTKTTLVFSN